jgi:Skp family chaperone for outer membrane proteins
MKLKSLNKKIRRLEARLQKGAMKLARVKQKREAVEAAALAKIKSKSTSFRAKMTRKTVPVSAPTQKKRGRLMPKMQARAADVRDEVLQRKRRESLISRPNAVRNSQPR